jgi:hypothetical protein
MFFGGVSRQGSFKTGSEGREKGYSAGLWPAEYPFREPIGADGMNFKNEPFFLR